MSNLMMCDRCHRSVMVHELHDGLCRSCHGARETEKRRKDDEHQQMVNNAVIAALAATTSLS